MTTPPKTKTKRDRKVREKAFDCSKGVHSKVSHSCFAQVNIEATRGHQSSSLAECHIISSEMCHNLRAYYGWQAAEKNTL